MLARASNTVEFHLKNDAESWHTHNVDFHAATGPGGGAEGTNAAPREEKAFRFKALNPDYTKLLDERPEYFVLNGHVGALTEHFPLKAKVGETIRIFFGVGGPNFTSSFHVIGEIFDRVYANGSITSAPQTDVQTVLVPAGGAVMTEMKLEVPGRYVLVDHSLSRVERGLAGWLDVEGDEDPEIFAHSV